jgi:hypothetical protein
VGEIDPDLHQITSLEGAGVKVDDHIAVSNDFIEQPCGYSRSQAPLGITREISVQVSSVGQITRPSAKSMDVDNRQAYKGPGKLVGLDLIGCVPYDLNPVELVSMRPRHRTQLRTWARTM